MDLLSGSVVTKTMNDNVSKNPIVVGISVEGNFSLLMVHLSQLGTKFLMMLSCRLTSLLALLPFPSFLVMGRLW